MRIALIVLLLSCTGCLRIRHYQDLATEKCLASHTAEQCRVLHYPSCEAGEGCQ